MFDSDPMCTQDAVKRFFCGSNSRPIHFSHYVNISKVWEVVNKNCCYKVSLICRDPSVYRYKTWSGTNQSVYTDSFTKACKYSSSLLYFFSNSSFPRTTNALTGIFILTVQLNLNYHRRSVGIRHYKFCLYQSIYLSQDVIIVYFSIRLYLWVWRKLVLAGIWHHTVTLY